MNGLLVFAGVVLVGSNRSAGSGRSPPRSPRSAPAHLSAALDDATVDEDRLASAIIELAETHAAFPALHYLHTPDETRSAPAMIANLGIALSRRRSADRRTPETPLHRAILRYLTLHPPVGTPQEAAWEARLHRIRLDDGRPPETRPAAMPPAG